ncbi:unnamed protein product [Urochloa humidicola]
MRGSSPHRARATAAAPPPPRLLRRPQPAPRHSASSWPSPATFASSSPTPRSIPNRDAFWEETPPPPPPRRSRSSAQIREPSEVPATPESQQGKATPQTRSYVQVVKGEAPAAFNTGQPKKTTVKFRSAIAVPAHSNYYAAAHKSTPQQALPMRRGNTTAGATSARCSSAVGGADAGWSPVRKPYWWRKERHSSREQRRSDLHSGRHQPASEKKIISLSLCAFRRKTDGRCFVCLARDHRAVVCRDSFRCFACNRSGHRARHCPSRRRQQQSAAAARHQDLPPPPKRDNRFPMPSRPGPFRHGWNGVRDENDERRGNKKDRERRQRTATVGAIFMSHAVALQEAAQHLLDALGVDDTHKTAATMLKDYVNKACFMATRLGIPEVRGNKASSALLQPQSDVPVNRAFSRIKEVLPADVVYEEGPTVADVEQALRRFELDSFLSPSHLTPQVVSPMQMPQELQAMNMAEPQLEDVIMMDIDTEEEEVPEVQIAAGNVSANISSTPAVADFFIAPAPPLLNAITAIDNPAPSLPSPSSVPARRPRQRRVFDMSSVRRSARLANAPRMPALQKAQHNLCRKLGLLENGLLPVEAALQDFVAMFNGPLPQDIIAALSEVFNINNDDDADELDHALASLVNEGIAELQEDAQEGQAQAAAAQLPEA